jgi:hypothetical protein
MKRWIPLTAVAALLAVALGGCIFIDPDDDHDWRYERIVWDNHTPYHIDNYLDGEFIGTVAPYDELTFRHRHLEGYRTFYSEAIEVETTWGPDEFYVDDGETFILDLYEGGTSSIRHRYDDETLPQ